MCVCVCVCGGEGLVRLRVRGVVPRSLEPVVRERPVKQYDDVKDHEQSTVWPVLTIMVLWLVVAAFTLTRGGHPHGTHTCTHFHTHTHATRTHTHREREGKELRCHTHTHTRKVCGFFVFLCVFFCSLSIFLGPSIYLVLSLSCSVPSLSSLNGWCGYLLVHVLAADVGSNSYLDHLYLDSGLEAPIQF